jgi:hypothetical protein
VGTILALPIRERGKEFDMTKRSYTSDAQVVLGPQRRQVVRRPLGSVVVVSGNSQPAPLLEALSADTSGYSVIHVESITSGYARIRQVMPSLVIVASQIDDVAACRLLSMLQLDVDVAGIPVVTCASLGGEHESDIDMAELDRDSGGRTPMNVFN